MRLALPPRTCTVPTPKDLAESIVKYLGDESHLRWLEPSHGTGVFVEAIALLNVQKERLVAIDLDPVESPADKKATTYRRVDFLKWAQTTEFKFDRIVGNPPYISVKRLPESLRKTAASILDVNGKPIGANANLWYAFVLASLRLLKEGGSLAFVLPSAAEFTNYSAAIRESLHTMFRGLDLYRCTRPLFEAVQEGTIVAIARGYGSGPCVVRRRRFSSRQALIQALTKDNESPGRICRVNAKDVSRMVALKSVASIRLGGVTGDAAFFLMDEEKRQHFELPISAMTSVVSKARHLRFPQIQRQHWGQLKDSGERVWLFNPTAQVVRENSPVRRYLDLDPNQGGCNRAAYKIARRSPWYRTPLLSRTDAFMSGMSRYGPYLCINDMEELRATNTLYAVTFLPESRQAQYKWALALMTSTVQRQIRAIGRHYADGLIKYEPGPLGDVKLPILKSEADHKSLYEQAVTAVLALDTVMAKDIADSVRM